VAVSGNASLAVTWVAPANTGGSAITDYLVKYSSNNGVAGSWTRYVSGSPIIATSCTVTGLTNGTPYVIKVIARNSVGISLPSTNFFPATPAATVPGSPTSVVAVRGNASLAVTWTAPANTGGAAITDYLVKYSSNNGSTWTRWGKTTVIAATSCTVTGLTNGTRYVIKVIARNAVGISPPSANSAPVPVFTNVHLNPTSQTVNYSASQAQLSYGDDWSFEMPSRDVWNNQIYNFTGPSTATSGTDRLVVVLTIPQGPVVAGFSTTPTGTYSFQFTNSTTSAIYTINFTVTS
jgi:Fibronectin type III domain